MKKYLLLMIIPLVIMVTILSNSQVSSFNTKRVKYYGQRTVRASEYLIKKANDSNITYENGDKSEMYEFKEVVTDHTTNTKDYRYIGRKANNYVYFNCVGEDLSTCEVWRIIGVFPTQDDLGKTVYRLKLIKNDSIGKYSFDESNNDYVNANLQVYLNGDYYNNLSYISKKMVGISKYYISGDSGSDYDGETFYRIERGSNTNKSVDFIGRVGLIYPSDYLNTYRGINNNCYSRLNNCDNIKDSWMYNMVKEPFWSMTQVVGTGKIYTISNGDDYISYNYNNVLDVYPVVYLNYDIVIESGDGSKVNPYLLRPMYDSEIQSEYEMLQSMGDLSQTKVNVDDTLSTKSIIILIFSSFFIVCGSIVLIRAYLQKRRFH